MGNTTTLIQLPKFSYTSEDFDTIIQDIKSLIKEHPEYNQLWDDFLESNAGRLIVEVTAYVIEKAISRMDWTAQEMFISTATQRQSIINLLKLINHRPSLPKSAKVNVSATVTRWIPPFSLPKREFVSALDNNGSLTRFEVIENASDGKPDYDYVYTVDTGTDSERITSIENIPFYQGTTYTEDDIYMEGLDNEKITLLNYPIIENSVRVYNYQSDVEYPEVSSFISVEAQQSELSEADQLPPYIIEIDDKNRATIVFGPSSLVKIPTKDERIKIIYRVGGGSQTNIVTNAINVTKNYTFDNNTRTTLLLFNPSPGFNGADEERLEDAKLTAPISLRSANKTVTREDYISHLEESSYVMMAQIICQENEPLDIYTEYGYYFPPLDTWIYIVPNKDNIESIDPFEYNNQLQIGRPYTIHREIAYEDFEFTDSHQEIYLKNFRTYGGFNLYITRVNGLTDASYQEDVDYTVNITHGSITRIATGDGGTIPVDAGILRCCYVKESQSSFYSATVKTFSGDIITLATTTNNLFPAEAIQIKASDGTIYTNNTDYTINYETNVITRLSTGTIGSGETVSITYASGWLQDENDNSEEKAILDVISNKKMICVNNYIKDSRYGTFDLAATIYCAKSLRKKVEAGLETYLRNLYKIQNRKYAASINKSQLILDIMSYEGVKGLSITYLGRNYDAYRRYVLEAIDLDELNEFNANKVEENITAKYNEVIVAANNMWEGQTGVENQRSGFIFEFKDIT